MQKGMLYLSSTDEFWGEVLWWDDRTGMVEIRLWTKEQTSFFISSVLRWLREKIIYYKQYDENAKIFVKELEGE